METKTNLGFIKVGAINVIYGAPKSGKSTLINRIIYHLVEQKIEYRINHYPKYLNQDMVIIICNSFLSDVNFSSDINNTILYYEKYRWLFNITIIIESNYGRILSYPDKLNQFYVHSHAKIKDKTYDDYVRVNKLLTILDA